MIPVPLPGGFGNVYSVGDLLLAAGAAALVYNVVASASPGRRSRP